MMPEQKKQNGKKRGAPKWATQPFRDFINQTERLGELLHLSMKGISMIRAVPKLVQALAKAQEELGEEANDRFERAKKEADLAHREVSDGFPLLHAQTAIALWSTLEATIRLFLVRWLQNYKQAMEVQAVQKLRVRIGEYERLEGEDRFFYIIDRLERELSVPLKTGITRFELLLEPFNLSGSIDEDVRRNLFEINEIRNTLVHRSGSADRRLIDSCPWLNLKVGDLVKIDHNMINRYFESVAKYGTELILRIGEFFGVDMEEFRSKPQATKEDGAEAVKKHMQPTD
jgi:hypothetical protein